MTCKIESFLKATGALVCMMFHQVHLFYLCYQGAGIFEYKLFMY